MITEFYSVLWFFFSVFGKTWDSDVFPVCRPGEIVGMRKRERELSASGPLKVGGTKKETTADEI